MNVVTMATSLVQFLLFVGGLVVGILLRRRDGKAATLVAIGFGVQIVGVLLSVVEGVAFSAYIRSSTGASDLATTLTTLTYGFSVVLTLLRLVAAGLIFFGLLRLVRRPSPATVTGVAR